jgi:hypothetical protein
MTKENLFESIKKGVDTMDMVSIKEIADGTGRKIATVRVVLSRAKVAAAKRVGKTAFYGIEDVARAFGVPDGDGDEATPADAAQPEPVATPVDAPAAKKGHK